MGGEQSWDRARWLWILALIGGISFFIAVYQRWDGPAIWAWKASGVGLLAAWAATNARSGDGRLIDTFRQVHPHGGDEATFHAFGRQGERAAIDWILVSGHFRVVKAGIDRFHEGRLFPSDHYPITAVLDWQAGRD